MPPTKNMTKSPSIRKVGRSNATKLGSKKMGRPSVLTPKHKELIERRMMSSNDSAHAIGKELSIKMKVSCGTIDKYVKETKKRWAEEHDAQKRNMIQKIHEWDKFYASQKGIKIAKVKFETPTVCYFDRTGATESVTKAKRANVKFNSSFTEGNDSDGNQEAEEQEPGVVREMLNNAGTGIVNILKGIGRRLSF